jgi:hypothetical protein
MVMWHSSAASCQVERAAYKQQHIKVAFQHACMIIVPRTHGMLHVTPRHTTLRTAAEQVVVDACSSR